MEPIIDFTSPMAELTALILFVLVLFLAKENKKSILMGSMLGVFIAIVIVHSIQYSMLAANLVDLQKVYANCIAFDCVFIFLSFICYLWIDAVEAKEKKRKIIDNSLEWFWTKSI